MKKNWLWIIGLSVILLLVLLVLLGTMLFWSKSIPMHWFGEGARLWRFNFFPHRGMHLRLPFMGVFGWLLMLAFPFGLLGLIVLGIVLLVRGLQDPGQSSYKLPIAHCKQCGKKTEPDWQICPYCSEPISEE